MAELSDDQRKFLRDQKLPLSFLFDASGMRKVDYEAVMKRDEKFFAFGVTPCSKGGHSLRTRSGHCIQCDTAKIAYTLRHYKTADVYVAGSLQVKLIKVGSSVDCDTRVRELNRVRYGGATDWSILSRVRSEKSGMVEFFVHDALKDKRRDIPYLKDGRVQLGSESFACDYIDAKSVLMGLCKNDPRMKYDESPASTHYSFSDNVQ